MYKSNTGFLQRFSAQLFGTFRALQLKASIFRFFSARHLYEKHALTGKFYKNNRPGQSKIGQTAQARRLQFAATTARCKGDLWKRKFSSSMTTKTHAIL